MAFPKWSNKDPDEVLDYSINWTPRLSSPDTIVGSEWFVPVGLIDESEAVNPAGSTTIWLSGGTLDDEYEVLNRIHTFEGRIMDQTVRLLIKTK